MYKIIACDLDQTLLKDDRTISVENLAVIKKALALGIKFVVATGRGYTSVQNVLTDIGIVDCPGEYVISLNGAVLSENKNNRVLSFNGISKAIAAQLFDYGIANGVCTHIYTEKDIFIYNFNASEREYLTGRIDNYQAIAQNDMRLLKDTPIAKMIFHYYDDAMKERIVKDIDPITAGRLAVSFSANRYVELNQLGIDKGTGLEELAKLLKVTETETMAIGDNTNDLAMIRKAGLGIGVANSSVDLKQAADYICKADNNHDAIKEALERFVFSR